MKVLFLDFDGVINPLSNKSNGDVFSKVCCKNLNSLLKKVPDLKIVVSSAWRTYGLPAIKDILKKNGINPDKVIDITGHEPGTRGHQIKSWLDRNKEIANYAILDDNNDMDGVSSRFIKTNSWVGLTAEEVKKVVDLLNRYDRLN